MSRRTLAVLLFAEADEAYVEVTRSELDLASGRVREAEQNVDPCPGTGRDVPAGARGGAAAGLRRRRTAGERRGALVPAALAATADKHRTSLSAAHGAP
jgi:hypothetical protein